MEEERSVKLHGTWLSPYVMRTKLALKIKGIDFENIEEDLSSKSELLLQYNPVHKKVPVLVHNGKAVAESTVIIEYIDEAWSNPPYLLPKDPYLRSKLRFWAAYLQQVVSETGLSMIIKEGEARENALKEWQEKLAVIEEGIIRDIYPKGLPSFKEVNPGYLDIVFYSLFGTHEAMEEFHGIKFLIPEKNPLLFSWVEALRGVPEVKEVKEVIPPTSMLLEKLQSYKQKQLSPKP